MCIPYTYVYMRMCICAYACVYVSGSDKRVHLVKIFETRFLTSFDSYVIGERVSVGSA